MYTPKQRMLNAYRGKYSDRYPVAPEFWYFYPAKVLGIDMVEFEREVPLWKALQTTFKKYGTEGWGVAFPETKIPEVETSTEFKKISETQYRETKKTVYKGKEFTSTRLYDKNEPSWQEEYPVKDEGNLPLYLETVINNNVEYDFRQVNRGHEEVGEDYLLEFWLGLPFFDLIAECMGFEQAIFYFMKEEEEVLQGLREKYIQYQADLIEKTCLKTDFEAFNIGCSFSTNSLLGPDMWRKWDKPYLKAITDIIHENDKLLHIHFHGESMKTAVDFVDIGIDCVCPFERPPGGDVEGLEGLKKVRELLDEKVTMNGNVHTVETLIRGNEQDVRREVQEIIEAFESSPRLIVGTGDQVGRETPEENIYAMVEEVKKLG